MSVTDRDASQQFIFHINFDYEPLYGCGVQFSKGKFPPPSLRLTHRTKNQIDLKLFFPKFLVESWLDTSCLKCNYTVINNFPPLFSVSTIPLPCGQWKFPPFIRLDSLALRKKKKLRSWHHCLPRAKSSEISLPPTQKLGPGLQNGACGRVPPFHKLGVSLSRLREHPPGVSLPGAPAQPSGGSGAAAPCGIKHNQVFLRTLCRRERLARGYHRRLSRFWRSDTVLPCLPGS